MKTIILLGAMGVGKTEYAKKFSKENKEFTMVSYDEIGVEGINNLPKDRNYIIDGMIYPNMDEINIPYETWAVIAPPDIIYKRYHSRPYKPLENYPVDLIEKVQKQVLRLAQKIVFSCLGKEESEWLINLHKEQSKYQYIEINGISNEGSKDCVETWNRIKDLGFSGKTLIDLGCHAGYFCQKATESGASVIGIDMPGMIRMANNLAIANNLNIEFRGQDMDIVPIYSEAHTILLLNTLHHLRSPIFVLWQSFKNSERVIIELELSKGQDMEIGELVQLSQKGKGHHYKFSRSAITKIAKENGHVFIKEIASARPNRTILVYKR